MSAPLHTREELAEIASGLGWKGSLGGAFRNGYMDRESSVDREADHSGIGGSPLMAWYAGWDTRDNEIAAAAAAAAPAQGGA